MRLEVCALSRFTRAREATGELQCRNCCPAQDSRTVEILSRPEALSKTAVKRHPISRLATIVACVRCSASDCSQVHRSRPAYLSSFVSTGTTRPFHTTVPRPRQPSTRTLRRSSTKRRRHGHKEVSLCGVAAYARSVSLQASQRGPRPKETDDELVQPLIDGFEFNPTDKLRGKAASTVAKTRLRYIRKECAGKTSPSSTATPSQPTSSTTRTKPPKELPTGWWSSQVSKYETAGGSAMPRKLPQEQLLGAETILARIVYETKPCHIPP